MTKKPSDEAMPSGDIYNLAHNEDAPVHQCICLSKELAEKDHQIERLKEDAKLWQERMKRANEMLLEGDRRIKELEDLNIRLAVGNKRFYDQNKLLISEAKDYREVLEWAIEWCKFKFGQKIVPLEDFHKHLKEILVKYSKGGSNG